MPNHEFKTLTDYFYMKRVFLWALHQGMFFKWFSKSSLLWFDKKVMATFYCTWIPEWHANWIYFGHKEAVLFHIIKLHLTSSTINILIIISFSFAELYHRRWNWYPLKKIFYCRVGITVDTSEAALIVTRQNIVRKKLKKQGTYKYTGRDGKIWQRLKRMGPNV